jgi:hypothetical protein
MADLEVQEHNMKIENEHPSSDTTFEVTLENNEREILLEYAKNNIETEVLEDLMIEWSLISILKKQLEKGEV